MYNFKTKDYNNYFKTKDYDKLNNILNILVEKNNNYIKQILNEKNSLKNFDKNINAKEKLLQKWKRNSKK